MNDGPAERQPEFGVWASADEKALISELGAFDPAIETLLAEHVKDYDYVLSTLFLADVVRWANARYLDGDDAVVSRLLSLLEDRYATGDRYVRELIAVGFVESMDASGQPAAKMRDLLGQGLADEYWKLNW